MDDLVNDIRWWGGVMQVNGCGKRRKSGYSRRTSRVSKYSPTLATNCSLSSSPSGRFSSGASVWGRERRARDVLARERRCPMSCVGGVGGYVVVEGPRQENRPFLLSQDHVFGGLCGMRTKLGLRRSPP